MQQYNLTVSQKLIWLDQLIATGSSKYNIGGYACLQGPLNEVLYHQAIRTVLASQEVYASQFLDTANGPSCYMGDVQGYYQDETMDFSASADPAAAAIDWMTKDFGTAFEIEHTFLFTFRLIKIDGSTHFWYAKIHHLISDGWSFRLLLNQAAAAYRELGKDTAYTMPSYRYSDYVLDDEAYYGSAESAKDRDFWLQEYRQVPAELVPRHPFSMEGDDGYTGSGSEVLYLSGATKEGLKKIADSNRVSLFHVFMSLFLIYFSRTRQQPNMAFGTPVLNRGKKIYKQTAGVFMNLLPIRFDLGGAGRFGEVLQVVKQKMLAVLKHQRYQYGNLVKDLRLPGNKPLYDVRVSYEDFDFADDFGGLKANAVAFSNHEETDKLAIYLRDYHGEGFDVRFVYRKDHFTQAMIRSVCESLQELVNALLVEGDLVVAEAALLGNPEKEELLSHAVGPVREQDTQCVWELWNRSKVLNRDRMAISCCNGSFTYGEIDRQVMDLLPRLQGKATGHGGKIALLLPRSQQMITGILASMGAGLCYIPLDIETPAHRIELILQDAGCSLVLTAAGVLEKKPGGQGVEVLEIEALLKEELPVKPVEQVAPAGNAPCYIIYTSGTSGTPKGVVIPHAAMADYVGTFGAYFQLTAADIFLQQSSISFDTSVEEIFPCLVSGGRLHVLENRRDLAGFVEAIEREGITVISTTPFVVKCLNEQPLPSSVRIVISGGDVLKRAYTDRLLQQGIAVYNTYGPTEATVCATYYRVNSDDTIIPIGKPIANKEVYILDDNLQPQPFGVEGDLFIAGMGLALGYVNSEILTREKFVAHFRTPGRKMYRTGDKGMVLPDGNILFKGRKDSQLNYRGYRIESAEVERAVLNLPGITECIVDIKELQDTPLLTAYIKMTDQSASSPGAWKQALRKVLPAYMVPDVWVVMEEWPLLLNGKVDRRGLPDIAPDMLRSSEESLSLPQTAVEEKMVAIWKEVLQQDIIGTNESFFDRGGHSLNIMQLVNQYALAFEVKLSIADLFRHTTIAAHALLVDGHTGVDNTVITLAETAADYPVSDGQRRLWLLSQLEGASRGYHLAGSIDLGHQYDSTFLELAIRKVIARHEILRTVFRRNEEGVLRQVILPYVDTLFTLVTDNVGTPPPGGTNSWQQLFVAAPFDLEKGLLFRAGVVKKQDGDYQFHYCMHHIISDGWSMELLKEEIFGYYQSYHKGIEPVAQALRIQYKDYAEWQQSELGTAGMQVHKQYWLQQLSGKLPVLDLSFGKKRPAVFTHRGYRIARVIPKGLTQGLHHLCRQQEGTLFMGLLAVLKALLFRYTGQEDIIVGVPVAGRLQAALENQIGCYINTLALRTQLEKTSTPESLIKNIRAVTLAAYEHQAFPFDRLVEELGVARNLSHAPVFDVMAVLHNQPGGAAAAIPQSVEADIEEGPVGVNFDLLLNFREGENGYQFWIDYNLDIFDQSSIISLTEHYQALLQRFVEHPAMPLQQLDLLPAGEKAVLLTQFNNTATDYRRDVTMVGVFEEMADRQPDSLAVQDDLQQLTYRQLDEQATRLARWITEQLRHDGSPIPVCMDRSADMVIVLLAILKTGAAYIPIDPAYPPERIGYLLEDSGANLLISHRRYVDLVPAVKGIDLIWYDEAISGINAMPATRLEKDIQPNDLAYIIYTSGSTGQPKGVMIEHTSVINLIEWHIRKYDVSPGSRSTVMAGVGFDANALEIWSGLLSGSCLFVIDNEMRLQSDQLDAFYCGHKITHAFVPPALIPALVASRGDGDMALQYILIGGDRLPFVDVSGLPYTLVNQYGPTECTVMVTDYPIARDNKKIPLIGKPIANTQLYILNGAMQLSPIGIAGEIYVGGAALARGYWHKEALTAERFVANPFAPGERLYRTGDMGRWLEDGNIEYLGRADEQVKVRGYRIEPGEVEYALAAIAGIDGALVVAVEAADGQKYLAGYVVSQELTDVRSIKELLGRQLPGYMVPTYIIVLDAWPLTANGKIDKRALPEPGVEGTLTEGYEGPANATEERVALIWQEVLHQATGIGVLDDFFMRGGHSLRMMQLLNHYYQWFGVKLTIAELFAHTTIRSQSALIAGKQVTGYSNIAQAPPAADYPLSDGQRRLWMLSQRQDQAFAYSMPGQLHLEGDRSIDHLQRAIHAVIARHEILRTVFRENEAGEVRQVVLLPEQSNFTLLYEDLTARTATVTAYIQNLSSLPFDLQQGPLLRATLLKTGDQQYILHYNMHHIISDGVSMEVLGREVLGYYEAFMKNDNLVLPGLRIQYKDYAHWQQQQLATESFKAHQSYWQQQLGGELPVLVLPADNARPPVFTHNGYCLATTIDAEVIEPFRRICQDAGATFFMGLVTVLKALFYRYSGQEDIIIGTPVAGREHPELENQIGFYLNTLALRTRFSGEDGFLTLLDKVKATTLAAYEHQAYPFDRLAEEVNRRQDTSRSALFDVMLTLQNQYTAGDTRSADILVQEGITEKGDTPVKFDLLLSCTEVKEGLVMNVRFNKDIYDTATIGRLIVHFTHFLKAVLAAPGLPISRHQYLSTEEIQQLTAGININESTYPRDKTMVDLFRLQVQQTPHAIAVAGDTEQLTYVELDQRSNQLARYLVQQGIGREDRVVISAKKTAGLIVGLLGIMKAGAVFVPVDPSFPADRNQYIFNDTGCKLILAEKELPGLAGIAADIRVADIHHDWATIGQEAATALDIDIHPEQLVYIIYTSGSTGRPKGVMIEHRSLVDHVYGIIPGARLAGCASFALPASLAADAYHSMLFAALTLGSTVHVLTDEVLHDGTALVNYFKEHKIDCLKIFPSLWLSYAREQMLVLPVKRLLFGGEGFSQKIMGLLKDQGYKGEVYNHYGPTETTIGVLLHPVDANRSYSKVPVGKPYSHTRVYVLDKALQPCPVGVTGELFAGGDGVARGYLNNSALTAEKFIEDPFLPGSRVYRTGDQVKWRSDGNIYYEGRIDDQVKVRGYRIELPEIEFALQQLPGIQSAAVVVHTDAAEEEKVLVGYYTSAEGKAPADIRTQLGNLLPDYMIPGRLIRLEKIPLTANGKTDRKQLPLTAATEPVSEKVFKAPENELEALLLEICSKILKKEIAGGMDGSFFESGGDSIKAILLASRLKQKGFTVTIGDILRYPVLRELVLQIHKTGSHVVKDTREETTTDGEVPLTPVQARFFDQSFTNKQHYNQSVLLYRKGGIDEALLRQCLQEIVNRHDALRMVYRLTNDEWKGYSRGTVEHGYHLAIHHLEQEGNNEEKLKQIAERLQASIDLEKGPLLKAALFHRQDGDRLLLVIHHLATDGVSWRILLEDISTIYTQLSKGEGLPPAGDGSSYRQWALQQAAYANSEEVEQELPYWLATQEAAPQRLPTDHSGGANREKDAGQVGFELDEVQTGQLLSTIHHAYNTRVNDVLLTALSISVKKTFDRSAILINLEGHGRDGYLSGIEVHRTVGWFTNIYPVVTDISDCDTDIDSLIAIKETIRKVPGNGGGYGFLRYRQGKGVSPLVQMPEPSILFNYLGDFGTGAATVSGEAAFDFSTGYTGKEVDAAHERKELLTVTGIVIGGKLSITIRYSPDSYEEATMRRLLHQYETSLKSLVTTLHAVKKSFVTPADLIYQGLTRKELQQLNEDGPVENIYGLSPLQEGIYYHWLAQQDAGAYIEQLAYRLNGKLDIGVLQKSYGYLVNRHAVLRTSFHHEYGAGTLQVVRKEVAVDFRHKVLPATADRDLWLMRYKEEDRREGFAVDSQSQMRLTVLDLGQEQYEFIWTSHHILMDGWCRGILIKELYTIYKSFLNGETPSLTRVTPYANYIQFIARLQDTVSKNYWAHYLAGYTTTATVPFKATHQGPVNYVARHQSLYFNAEQVVGIRRLCRGCGVTESVFVQAVWAFLLSRYNNSKDVVFGLVVSGRPAELDGVENMIGLFINTLPVRVQLEAGMTMKELLQKIQADAIAGVPHHYLRLSELQTISGLGNQLFDHILTYENYPVEQLIGNKGPDLDGLEGLSLLGAEVRDQTNYDLTVMAVPEGEGMYIKLGYNGALFTDEAILRIKTHLEQAVNFIIRHEETSLSAIEYLPMRERQLQVERFNTAVAGSLAGKTIIDLFYEQVDAMPDDIAVVCGGSVLSYQALDALSNQWAHYLVGKGIKPGTLVPLCTRRSTGFLVAILGIIKAGAAYVPIDPSYPAERIGHVLNDLAAPFAIVHEDYTSLFTISDSATFLCTENNNAEVLACAESRMEYRPQANDLAYVIYTSGSTGRPKGVMIEHGGVVNLSRGQAVELGITRGSVVLQFASPAFDASCYELFNTLLNGGKLVVATAEEIHSPALLADMVRKEAVEVAVLPPSLLPAIREGIGSLKTLVSAGEPLNRELARSIQSLGIHLINAYGPTENTVCATLSHDPVLADGKVTIGKPIRQVTIHILDYEGGLLPVGIAGEICIGGAQVARGYFNRADLTARQFIKDRFSEKENARLYRTGDIGRWLEDGNIEYLGRADEQVKVRGYRIEPGEVEYALAAIAGIDGALVVAVEGADGQKYLAGYVVSQTLTDVRSIKELLGRQLPGYMVPTYIIVLDAWPLTANGKIDKRALPEPGVEGTLTEEYEGPANATEERVALIWQEVLHQATGIGVLDDFFMRGGHSLRMMQLLNHYYQWFGVKLTIAELFAHTTIRSQSALIAGKQVTGYSNIAQAPPAADYPLSDGQRRLWVLSQIEQASQAYHLSGQLLVQGDQVNDHLQRAIHAVIARHEILRTVFRENEAGELRQVVLPIEEAVVTLHFFDAREMPAAAQEIYVQQEAARPFRLSEGPLLRAGSMQVGEGQYLFHFTMHHIIGDGWSMNVLAKEVFDLFTAYQQGVEQALLPLRIQYKDYAVWQQSQAQTDFAAHRAYWLRQLGGVLPVLSLPVRNARPPVFTYRGHSYSTIIGPALTHALKNYCRQHQATLYMGLLAGMKMLLYRYTGQEDIIVGSPVSGREHIELEGQLGFYLNALALRSSIKGQDDFSSLLGQVQQTVLAAYEHQSYPFDRIIHEMDLKRDTSRSALFDVWLDLHADVTADKNDTHRDEQSSYDIIDQGSRPAKFDITFIVEDRGDDLQLNVEFNVDIYGHEMIKGFIGHYISLLTAALNDPYKPVNQLDYLSTAELVRLTDQFSGGPSAYAADQTIIGLFEARAREHPDTVAVSFDGESLTYGELAARSNQFAHYLLRKKAGAGTFVAVCMDRSIDMMVGILGILKAGAVFVPVDPAYPIERIRYILKDVQAGLLVTHTDHKEQLEEVTGITKFYTDRDWIAIEIEPATPVPATVSANDLAYIIYTSGSTGEPKGVMVQHDNLGNYLYWVRETYLGNAPGNFGLYSSLSFDLTITSLFGALISGGRLHIFPQKAETSEVLSDYLKGKHALDIIKLTPAHISLIEALNLSATSIRTVITGGEALLDRHVAILRRLNKDIVIYNEYGPTEVTVGCIVAKTGHVGERITIGKPITNTSVYILDECRQPVPVGVTGELYLAGSQLARGYWNKEVITAEKFIDHQIGQSTRLYKSGDLGRWLPDGAIEYLGRIDDQIKIRGYRIEAGEVENALLQWAGVEGAKVVVYEPVPGNKELVAYLTGNKDLSVEDIKVHLRRYLPGYMIPAQLVLIEQFPLNKNGKIDMGKLPGVLPVAAVKYTAPVTDTEVRLIEIIASVLGRNATDIGTEDNFFDLGANSLLLVKMAGLINERLQQNLKVVTLFEYANVKELARHGFTEPVYVSPFAQVEEEAGQQLDDALTLFEE
ncbi:amino acid adenylation domain-containing protein [Paraflavitalea soli]|uniref:Amino acid adenylation domain-containing protein n=1 Tax=Paraflavitalea soli TaxID=2315862 RepID=A0A3B7MNM7_9BACT|nr:non-ribosomal peptide synthetase [Paraflavitalea soli]AXY74566.1 amino acid adenylation domain-containing protein [Paraflavitalea soli]